MQQCKKQLDNIQALDNTQASADRRCLLHKGAANDIASADQTSTVSKPSTLTMVSNCNILKVLSRRLNWLTSMVSIT
ncbi:hypothetical protein ACOSP7_004437 [Xanthoceras sorbifolium]